MSWPTGIGTVSAIGTPGPNPSPSPPNAVVAVCWFCTIFWPRAVPCGPMSFPSTCGALLMSPEPIMFGLIAALTGSIMKPTTRLATGNPYASYPRMSLGRIVASGGGAS